MGGGVTGSLSPPAIPGLRGPPWASSSGHGQQGQGFDDRRDSHDPQNGPGCLGAWGCSGGPWLVMLLPQDGIAQTWQCLLMLTANLREEKRTI
jgi:hypothetical protein